MPVIESLAAETVLIVGGSSGVGLMEAKRSYARGANVILTSRDIARAEDAASHLKGGIGSVTPLGLELSDPTSINGAVKYLRDNNIRPRIIRNCGATGLEGFFGRGSEVFKTLREIGKLRGKDNLADYKEAVAGFNRRVENYVTQNKDHAVAVNFEGPKQLITGMSDNDLISPGSLFIFDSSIPSSFPSIDFGKLYKIVSSTKGMTEEWLIGHAEIFSSREAYVAVISGYLFKEGRTAKAIRHFLAFLPEEEQKRIQQYMINPEDMLDASDQVLELLDSGSLTKPVSRLFIYGENGRRRITDELDSSHPMFKIAVPIG